MNFKFILLFFVMGLTACSSSDSETDTDTGTDTTPNQAPSVSVDDASGLEKSTLTIAGNATDSDGSISNYLWQQTSGLATEMTASGASLELILPAVTEPQDLVFSLTVTDDKGGTASASFTVVVEPIVIPMVVTGEVTTSRFKFVDTDVQLSAGSQTWVSNTNELGVYRFEVEIDDDHLGDMLTLTTSPNVNTINKLVSLLPSVNELTDDVSESIIIDSQMSSSVNISTMTTAQYLLAKIKDEEPISSYNDYLARHSDWSASFAFNVVTLIDVISNEVFFENFTDAALQVLPLEFTSLYEFLDNEELLIDLALKIREADPYAWDSSIEKFAEQATMQFSSDDLTALIVAGSLGKVSFNQNGTGSLDGAYDSAFTWALENGQLTLELESDNYPLKRGDSWDHSYQVETMTLTPIYATDKGFYVYYQQAYTSGYSSYLYNEDEHTVFTPIVNTVSLADLVAKNNKWYFSFADANSDVIELPETESYAHINGNLRHITFDDTPVREGVYSVEVQHFGLEEGEIPTLNTYTTEVTEVDGLLQFSFSDYLVKLALVESNEDDGYIVFSDVENLTSVESNQWAYGSAVPYQAPVAIKQEDVAGKKLVFSDNDSVYYNWLEFNEDGTFIYFFAEDGGSDGIITELYTEDTYIYASVGLWMVEDGQIKVLRHRGTTNYTCLNGDWAPSLEGDCRVYAEQTYTAIFDLATQDSGYLIRDSQYYWDYRIDTSAYPAATAYTPFFYTYYMQKFDIQEERPLQLPSDVLEQLSNR